MNARRFPRTPDLQNRPFQDGANPFADDSPPAPATDSGENLYGSPAGGNTRGDQPIDYECTLPNRSRSVLTYGAIGAALSVISIGFACISFASPDWQQGVIYVLPIALVGVAFSIPGWMMGTGDLRAMRAGAMDPSGRRATRRGLWLGCFGTLLGSVPCAAGLWALLVAILF